ncbi:MAG: hypothetical protein CL470_01355 [Acidimicrobiaceae bacterium]|nr:hypothetical protein [Acidimicrobiaceae bacterium]
MRVAQELMTHYQHEMSSVLLIPGDKGIFDVKVNGNLIYSKHTTGRFPKPEETSAINMNIV